MQSRDPYTLDKVVGYGFRPTDEELVFHYLKHKLLGDDSSVHVMPDIELCDVEPWDVPVMLAKSMIRFNDPEWFFFSRVKYKYSNSKRVDRTTKCGYWKTTGKERQIRCTDTNTVIGTKKTLVFHEGRFPHGVNSNWVIHEYHDATFHESQRTFVLCRLIKKPEKTSEGEIDALICDEGEPSRSIVSGYENHPTAEGIPSVGTFTEIGTNFQEKHQAENDFSPILQSPIGIGQEEASFQNSPFYNAYFRNEQNLTQTPFGIKQTSFEITQTPFEITQTPFGIKQTSFEVTQTPFEITQTPFGIKQTPFEVTQTPFEITQTPFGIKQTPFEVTQTSFEIKQTPFEVTQTSFGTKQIPFEIEIKQTPFEVTQTSFGTKQTPFEITQTSFGTKQTPFEITQTSFETTEEDDFLNSVLADEILANEESMYLFVNSSTQSKSLKRVYCESRDTDTEVISKLDGNIVDTSIMCKEYLNLDEYHTSKRLKSSYNVFHGDTCLGSSNCEEKNESIFQDDFWGLETSSCDSTGNKSLDFNCIEISSSPSTSGRWENQYHPRPTISYDGN